MAEPITVTITNLNSPIRVAKVTNKVAESAVTSVAGRVGDITLTKNDVAGVENVNNTSDLNKPISTATQAAIDGIALTPGPIGPIGPSGLQGPIGPSGDIGLTGPIGPSGLQGPIGPSGDIGPSGAIGPIGPIGPSGLQGPIGPSGDIGPSGAIGLTGPSGADAVVDNTAYGISWSGDTTQAATRDALYNEIEILPRFGDNVSDFNNDALYISSGDNVSNLTNDAGYLTSVSEHPVLSVNTLTGVVVIDPDDLDDTSTSNKFTTQAEIDKLSGIAPNAEVNVNADWGSVGGDSEILNKPAFGDITGSNIADFATSGQGDLADSALQSGDNVSLLVNDTGYLLSGDNISVLNNNSLYVASGDNVSDLANDALYITSGDINTISNLNNVVTDATLIDTNDSRLSDRRLPIFTYRSETGNYTVVAADYTIDCISGDQTITMLDATTVSGQIFVVKNSSPSVITITGTSSQTFDGNASVETDFPQSLTLQSTNTNWIII